MIYIKINPDNSVTLGGQVKPGDDWIEYHGDIPQPYTYTTLNGIVIQSTRYELQDGVLVAVKDENFVKQVLDAWKNDRKTKINNIIVEYNGVKYQGDETSQTRISRAITALSDDNTTIPWIAADNSIQQLTRQDLKNILALIIEEQNKIWLEPRPI